MPTRGTISIFALSLLAAGCPPKDEPPGDTFDRSALLASIAQHAVLAPLRTFEAKAAALAEATAGLRDAVASGADDVPGKRAAAREAWRAAIAAWQELESIQVGPAGLSTATTGGLGLRDRLYSWPITSPCRVDQETVAGDFATDGFFGRSLVNVGGLDAVEYLLFRDDTANACAPQATINDQGTWNALGEAEVVKRRAAYAAAASADVKANATVLVNEWAPSGNDFGGKLAKAGKDGGAHPSAKAALDEVFAAMFHADKQIKDAKLGDPAGITTKCASDACPELLESKWAKASKEHIAANLRGLRRVLLGGEPADKAANTGFDDFVDAIAAVEGIEGTLDDALVNDADGVATAHAAVKAVTDLLKSQFVTVLNLSVPQEGAADND